MGLFSLFTNTPTKHYRIPAGTKAKDYARSLLDDVEYHCEEINKSATVFDFFYSYEKLSELVDELIWLNEKKHVYMAPSPRFNWSEIQRNMPLTINAFLDRALRLIPRTGEGRADAIEALLEEITHNKDFWQLFNYDNKNRVDNLRNEATQIRERIQERTHLSGTIPSLQQRQFAYYGGHDAELLNIDLMEGHDFENWCAEALKFLGFYDVEVTPPSGDHGVDVLAKKDGIKYAIQCKRYNSDLGNTPIQEVHAGKSLYHCHVGVVITNRYFTAGAKKLADATDTLLWDRDWIKTYLQNHSSESRFNICDKEQPSPAPDNDYTPELFNAAVDVILETGQASVSMIQRRLKLGYARAAKIIDEMEQKGFVGPFSETRPRAILITKQQWERRK